MNALANVPPFWLLGIAILVVLFFMAEFPRAGGGLLLVLVIVMLLQGKKAGLI
jgi:hypothetical protein